MNSHHDRPSMIDRLILKCKTAYHNMPARLRIVLAPLRFVYYAASVLRPDLWIIVGREPRSQQELTILYAGNDQNRQFLKRLALQDCSREESIGKTWLWNIRKASGANHNADTLTIVEVPRSLRAIYRRPMTWYVPCWIHGELDISPDHYRLANNRSLRSDINKIKKSNLSFEVTNDAKECYDFYHTMHLPFITQIHRGAAVVIDYEVVKQELRTCDLIFIRKGEERLGGSLIRYSKDKAELWFLGIKDGDPELLKHGVTAALYYFPMQYLQTKGIRRVDFGPSRPFFRNGVLQYKRKWDQRLSGISAHGFVVRPLSMGAAVKGFFCNNPFIYPEGSKLNGAIFIDDDELLSPEFFVKTSKQYHLNGMANLVVFRFANDKSDMSHLVPSSLQSRITVRSVECECQDDSD
jgi:hypothetical protein